MRGQGTPLAVQWLRLRASSAGGAGSIPSRETKIPHAARMAKKKRMRGPAEASRTPGFDVPELVQSHAGESDLWFQEQFSPEGCSAKTFSDFTFWLDTIYFFLV